MEEITILAKVKFDLRDPDEAYFAQNEIEAILDTETKPIKTIAALFKHYPFSELEEDVIHLITRHLYLGEIQGYMARVDFIDINKLMTRPAFFREIYVIASSTTEREMNKMLSSISDNLYQVFKGGKSNEKEIITIRLIPVQTLFEYVTDVKKLPAVAITPKNYKNWKEYFTEKEYGIEKGLEELFSHIKNNYYRAPHLGLGKKHIGDFIDWASTDLRKPFLHYLHKYKGKGDPRISRALINLLKVDKGETILDPFAGSGAFIADAPTMGINAIGVEILEIGKTISEVKCDLNYDLQRLKDEITNLFSNINYSGQDLYSFNIKGEIEQVKKKLLNLTEENRFFTNILPHLQKVIYLKDKIEQIHDDKIKKFLLLLLSQKIVEFSEKRRSNNFILSFQNYVEDRYLTLYATLKLAEKLNIKLTDGDVKIIKADSTKMDFLKEESIDGILTSPPYFDALDYIGNNKVSIIILGFDDDLNFGSTKEYYTKFQECDLNLPESSLNLINLLKKSKRSMKAQIVENYLKMMKLSFRECYRVLKKEKFYAMVVSKYHTWIINGKEQRIETSKVLADLGISEGFKLARIIQHGLSKADKGKINVEDILLFQK
ncbi:MAG: hypothetical protein FE044_00940 [Thermoplasmata archaeon]|nr:MAG: hypothetical protein FE044_00940 [Thermoplasmata archaeon]KAA0009458.1 MAG: hypothetical protein FE036_00160 [Thermoplasmata archaeon]